MPINVMYSWAVSRVETGCVSREHLISCKFGLVLNLALNHQDTGGKWWWKFSFSLDEYSYDKVCHYYTNKMQIYNKIHVLIITFFPTCFGDYCAIFREKLLYAQNYSYILRLHVWYLTSKIKQKLYKH